MAITEVLKENRNVLVERKTYLMGMLKGMIETCTFIPIEVLEGNDDLDFEMDNIKNEIREINRVLDLEEFDGID